MWKVNVEVQRAAEALDQRHRARVARLRRKACLFDQMRGNGAIDDAQYLAHDVGLAGKQEPQRERHTKYPLSHRRMRQNLVHQHSGTIRHSPCPAAGTKSALFATERQQLLLVAGFAAHEVKTMLKTSAFEVFLEFPPHVIRQHLALGRPLHLKCGIVLFEYNFNELLRQAKLGEGGSHVEG